MTLTQNTNTLNPPTPARPMRVYCAKYWAIGRYQHIDDRHEIVVAETSSTALGLLLEHHYDTISKWWTLTEINTDRAGVHIG